jgi:hypothetical protein
MRPSKRACLLTLTAVLTGLALWARPPAVPRSVPAEPAVAPGRLAVSPPLVGTASCSARGCHGAAQPRPGQAADARVRLDEFTRWIGQDPHVQAFAVLGEERAWKIAAHLGIKDAARDARCLACHTNPWAATADRPGGISAALARQERLFGVGCESCHGPARDWLVAHTTTSWEKLSPPGKRALGMVPTRDIAARTQACAGCHVGAPPGPEGVDRDVNHDLIAAGHPRLNFEPAAFLANLPPHWNPSARQPQRNDAQAWAVGQAACAEAALALLTQRAGGQPWPEFAEYDCFACHHDLEAKSWRQSKQHYGGAGRKRTPGALPWGDWYFSMPRLLAADLDDPELGKRLDALASTMQRPLPDGRQVQREAGAATAAVKKLRDRLATAVHGPDAVQHLVKTLTGQGGRAAAGSWDAAEQLYQAAWALDPARGQPGGWAEELRSLAPLRAFPPEAGQPEGQFDSPRGFRPDSFFDKFSAVLRGAGR